jgi:LAO/AO transport system kinase
VRTADPEELLAEARQGSRAALARLLSIVERGGEPSRALGRLAYPLGGHAFTVGLTGAPGAGKSTLTNALVRTVRAGGDQVAVLAVDPSSPFSGGAILGDRVRMGDHALDDGVFIRSMATRGHLGGLSLATPAAVGIPWVVVETVGVGQVEVEVAGAADTTVVVVNPGWGDAVQANKAGLMEIADVFVINKADRAGTDDTRRDLQGMLELSDLSGAGGWEPPIVATVASTGEGVDELWAAIGAHRDHLCQDGRLERKRAERLRDEIGQIVGERLRARAQELLGPGELEQLEAAVLSRELDPHSAADRILGTLGA